MPFLDSVDSTDRRLFEKIIGPLHQQKYFIIDTISHPELNGVITDSDRAMVALLVLELYSQNGAARMRSLRWVEDGIQPQEDSVFWALWQDAKRTGSGGIFNALITKPWVRDSITASETNAVAELMRLYFMDNDTRPVLSMPFLHSIESTDIAILQSLTEMQTRDRRALLARLAQGGITDDHTPGELALLVLESKDPDLVAGIRAFSWVQDGVDRYEGESLIALSQTAPEIPMLLEMPFLQEWDSLDLATLQTLSALPQNYLEQIVSHPLLIGGITDEWTNVVGSIGMIGSRPDFIEVLLDPERTYIEERVITFPNTGEVRLSVIWPGKAASEVSGAITMELLEQAVRSQEEFMGVAFPLDHAIIVDVDAERFRHAAHIAGIIATPWVEVRGLIAHEMAHTYWRDETAWLNEGGASWLDVVSHRDYDGTPLPTSELPCTLFDNLYDLEHSGLGSAAIFGSGCPYFLGRGLFRELYESLGDGPARRGYGNLYLALRDDSYDDVCSGDDRSACYVREAFREGATAEQEALVEEILARLYYGPNRTPAPR